MSKTDPAKVDFGMLGAKRSFAGALATSWGSFLVEPPSIGHLRAAAGAKLAPLGDVAPARSGIATRVVAYFIVEELFDEEAIRAAGIRTRGDRERLMLIRDGRGVEHVIERAALRPMVRRPGALEGRIDVPEEVSAPWWVLYIDGDKEELRARRWAHTLSYIEYGETTDFPAREGSRRRGGIPAEREQVRVRPVWFQVPRMDTGGGRVCWIKGRGDHHYAPVLGDEVLVPDNFLYSSAPDLLVPRVFAAVANLSWTHLMAEVFGRRSGGDGVLHTYKRELDMLPIIDPRLFTRSESEDLVALFDRVAARPVQSVADELQDPHRQAFDAWAMEYLFGSEAAAAGQAVDFALRDLTAERTGRSASGRTQERKAVTRKTFDPAPVGTRILQEIGPPPSVLAALSEVDPNALDTVVVDIPEHGPLANLRVGDTLFDAATVMAGHEEVVTCPSEVHANLAMAALRAEPFIATFVPLPVSEAESEEILRSVNRDWDGWATRVVQAVNDSLAAQQRTARGRLVLAEVEKQAGVATGALLERA